MERFDIFYLTFPWNGCADQRPWLIVDFRGNNVGCYPISGHCYTGECFFISNTHPDFVHTGLKKSCHVHDVRIIEINANLFVSRRGELRNELLKAFCEYSGHALP